MAVSVYSLRQKTIGGCFGKAEPTLDWQGFAWIGCQTVANPRPQETLFGGPGAPIRSTGGTGENGPRRKRVCPLGFLEQNIGALQWVSPKQHQLFKAQG